MHSRCKLGIIGSIACLLLIASGTAKTADDLSLVVSDANPIYANANETGILDRLAHELFGRLGQKIRIIRLPSERALTLANQGKVDGDLFRIAGLEKKFPSLRMIPEPWLEMSFVAFTLQENLHISTWKDLFPLHIAFIKGWQIFEDNIKQARSIIKADNTQQLFAILKHRRVDAILYDARQGEWIKQEMGISAARIAGDPLIVSPIYAYLHSKHADRVPKIAAELSMMKRDGTWQRIMDAENKSSP
ncbi:MAG: transporter substrate-binding domain-containing protein [Magnetococcus sp. YQC-5]